MLGRRLAREFHQRLTMLPVMLPQQLDLASAIAAADAHRAEVIRHHVTSAVILAKIELQWRTGASPVPSRRADRRGRLSSTEPAALHRQPIRNLHQKNVARRRRAQ